ncbi:hypothetical protein ACHAQA_002165 [Verticillium albo-atrum]
MAELVGLIASSLALAEFGARLSLKLYAVSRTLASAPADARALASEISLAATVVRELAVLLEADREATASAAAVGAAVTAVAECLGVFEEVDGLLGQSLARMEGGRGGRAMERVRWAMGREKLDGLRARLERLKAGLGLMLQVLGYARDVKGRKIDEEEKAYRRQVIGSLALLEKEMRAKSQEDGLPPYEKDEGAFNMSGVGGDDDGIKSLGVDAGARPNVAGELLLCCQLLQQLVAAEPRPAIPRQEYQELAERLRRLQQGETTRLKAEVGGGAFDRSRAVKQLHERLLEVATAASERKNNLKRPTTRVVSSPPPPLSKLRGSRPPTKLNDIPAFRPHSPTMPYEPTSPCYEPTSPYFEASSPGYEATSPCYSPVLPEFSPSPPPLFGHNPVGGHAGPVRGHAVYSEVIVCHPSTRAGESYTEIVEATYRGSSDVEDVKNDALEVNDDEENNDEDDSRVVDELLAKWTTVGITAE